jgi:hypothetical protein
VHKAAFKEVVKHVSLDKLFFIDETGVVSPAEAVQQVIGRWRCWGGLRVGCRRSTVRE